MTWLGLFFYPKTSHVGCQCFVFGIFVLQCPSQHCVGCVAFDLVEIFCTFELLTESIQIFWIIKSSSWLLLVRTLVFVTDVEPQAQGIHQFLETRLDGNTRKNYPPPIPVGTLHSYSYPRRTQLRV